MNRSKKAVWKGLAVDLGASSGRVVEGKFDGEKLTLLEVHRFENEPVQLQQTLHWDILRLYHELKLGFRKAQRTAIETGQPINSAGIDSWAVDFGLLDRFGNLLGNPVHYRDHRNDGMMEEAFRIIPKNEIYGQTGIQFMPFNSIYQLLSMKLSNHPFLDQAGTFLMIPDLLQYFLTGEKLTEFTNATSTQLYDPVTSAWSESLIERLGLPSRIFTSIVQPGTVVGGFLPSVAQELGMKDTKLIAVATHDTGSAVAAVPSTTEHFAYISCGTWSLLGTEVKHPVMTEKALEWNFTNEGGVEGTYRLLKNIMGLWILQETKRTWEREGTLLNWQEMTRLTEYAEPFTTFIDPDDNQFLSPGNMPERIRKFCNDTGQQIPQSNGALLRCVTESLALKYRSVLERLEELAGFKIEVIHMVGGGIQNELLCQWTANACGRPVIAGPIEASALGNIVVQLMAAGEVSSLLEARQIIAHSFPCITYEPQDIGSWHEAYDRFKTYTP